MKTEQIEKMLEDRLFRRTKHSNLFLLHTNVNGLLHRLYAEIHNSTVSFYAYRDDHVASQDDVELHPDVKAIRMMMAAEGTKKLEEFR